mgnify:FL=1
MAERKTNNFIQVKSVLRTTINVFIIWLLLRIGQIKEKITILHKVQYNTQHDRVVIFVIETVFLFCILFLQ